MSVRARLRSTSRTRSLVKNRSANCSTCAAVADAPAAEASASMTSVRRNVADRSVRPCAPANSSKQRSTTAGSSGAGRRSTEARGRVVGTEADVGGLVAPALLQRLDVDAVVLGLAGRRGSRPARRAPSGSRTRRAPLRSRARRFENTSITASGTPTDFGVAVHDRRELHAQPIREQVAQVRLVQVAGGPGVLVQPDAGDRPPPRDRRAVDAGHVRGHDMGVQQRIAGPAGAMIERGGHDPRRGDQVPLATALAGEHRVGLVVADDLVDRLGVRPADLADGGRRRRAPTGRSRSWAAATSGHSRAEPSTRGATTRSAPARRGSPSTRRSRAWPLPSALTPTRYADGSATTSPSSASARRARYRSPSAKQAPHVARRDAEVRGGTQRVDELGQLFAVAAS